MNWEDFYDIFLYRFNQLADKESHYIEIKMKDSEYQNLVEDLKKIEIINSTAEFFEYFNKKYNDYTIENEKENYLKKFKKLAKKRNWKNLYSEKLNSFYYLEENEVEPYLKANFDFYGLDYVPNNFEDDFNNFAIFMNWEDFYDIFLYRFNQLAGKDSEEKFKNLNDLQKILIRYEISPKNVPTTLIECKNMIKKHLFVNIYDFINEKSTKKFLDIKALSAYTNNNNLIYPRQSAKKNFCYKALLKKLYFKKKVLK